MPSNLNLRLGHPLANCANRASFCPSSSDFVPRPVVHTETGSLQSPSSCELLLLVLAVTASDRDRIKEGHWSSHAGSAPRSALLERLSTQIVARPASDAATCPRVRMGSARPTMATPASASPYITPVGPRQHGRAQHH